MVLASTFFLFVTCHKFGKTLKTETLHGCAQDRKPPSMCDLRHYLNSFHKFCFASFCFMIVC